MLKINFAKHLTTLKHKNEKNDTKWYIKNPKKPQTLYQCINCNKYTFRKGITKNVIFMNNLLIIHIF